MFLESFAVVVINHNINSSHVSVESRSKINFTTNGVTAIKTILKNHGVQGSAHPNT